MHLLGAETISLSYPNRTVLDGVTIGIDAGDRIGIVGRNGDGKSTLLTILAGLREPDSGRVTRRRDVTTGYLHQTDDFAPGSTIRQAVVGDAADHEWAAVPRIRDVMSGLLVDLDLDQTVDGLSGGQRRRVALAALLAGDHDVLFLDEPTNHLDVEGIAWLARHLKNRWPAGQGAFLVVTHDRWFLDEVTTQTWEVHDGTVDQYEGGYAAYVLQRVERRRLADQAEAKRQNLMRKELAWLRRGAPARTSKPKFRIDAANALIADVPPVRNTVELVGMATSRLGKDVFELTDVGVDYPGTTVLDDLDWILGPGDRVGILGRNGAGKSTLAGLLTGDVEPTRGRVKRGKTVVVAVLDQQLRDLEPVMGEFVRELLGRKKTEYRTAGGDLTPGQLAEKLGLGDVLANRVQDLSGGQRRRLQFLLTLLDEPNVLILDEPTNDMDTDMLAAMEDLLDTWAGTLLVISHDRYFMERVTDDQFAVRNAGLRHLPGGIDEYLRLSAQQDADDAARAAAGSAGNRNTAAEAAAGSAGAGTSGAGGSAASAGGPTGAERRAAQKELSAVERRMGKLQSSIEKVHARMAEHDQSDFEGLASLTQEQQGHEAELAELEERWLELSDTLE
ncbi:MAG TPA: ABC-F family ATP-binding cassette domain-containing protein [Brevibacterium senegalense]|uniref:ABC-F family ATP-binding cassette domain-containing protein n=1 Tax=Brevibacterium senegalense TaxID=1033736 RepID=A0A921SPB8_9MICO|nr:ABC-F family ATP-binding cassette domain-containing protein [Brevibacterium senegalense]